VTDFDLAKNLFFEALEHFQNQEYESALVKLSSSDELLPQRTSTLTNMSAVLIKLKKYSEAELVLEKIIAMGELSPQVLLNQGLIELEKNKNYLKAIEYFDKAILVSPNYSEAWLDKGVALNALKRQEEALESYKKAIVLNPESAEIYINLAVTLEELNRWDEAFENYDKAIAIKPNFDFLFGSRLHAQMNLCDWTELSIQLHKLELALEKAHKITPAFSVIAMLDKPDLHLKASKIFVNAKYPASNIIGAFSKPESEAKAKAKIRVGYYSADFYNHATSFLMAELFESHDSKKFDIYGFSFGPNKQDDMQKRVFSSFYQYFDVSNMSDRDVAKLSRSLNIDIAVDLKGYTHGLRMGIFAEQCAPIQVNYLGYPGSLGADYIDYIVADETLIPKENQQYYSEKIIYLPHSYQVNDSKRKISQKLVTKVEVGLPESGFVFCCFNNNYKILPSTFDSWMRILHTVKGSVLWLLAGNPTATINLCAEAKIRGIEPSRLIFAEKIKLEEHLARHQLADLFIDTLPYNAHTTTSDALWAGLPVLTLIGESFASRVAASLLNAMDLPELITLTQSQYESKAIELANNPFMLAEIKEKVKRSRQTSPLFNAKLFARHIESAYEEINKRYMTGKKPDHIYVEA
jgi:predicted O-linked N-acetylglucosamine transferase (SPINDLY family)